MATTPFPELRRATPSPTTTTAAVLIVASASVSPPMARVIAPMLAKFIGNTSHFPLSV